jgi:hypothetical protein
MTPSEMLIEFLTNGDPDSVASAILITRRKDGAIGYRIDGEQQSADTIGLLRFVAMSVEDDTKRAWHGDD